MSFHVQTLDGTPIGDLDTKWLRSQVVVVSQEPTLFDLTVAENIAYGLDEQRYTRDDVEEAAKMANIHDFLRTLPQVGTDVTHVLLC